MVKKSIKQIEIIEKETIKDLQNSTNAWLYEWAQPNNRRAYNQVRRGDGIKR